VATCTKSLSADDRAIWAGGPFRTPDPRTGFVTDICNPSNTSPTTVAHSVRRIISPLIAVAAIVAPVTTACDNSAAKIAMKVVSVDSSNSRVCVESPSKSFSDYNACFNASTAVVNSVRVADCIRARFEYPKDPKFAAFVLRDISLLKPSECK
jgi:hypothetical protein